MKENDNQTNFSKYLKIGSWILTFIVVISMFKSVLTEDFIENVIETAESEEKRQQYIEEKYGNMSEENN